MVFGISPGGGKQASKRDILGDYRHNVTNDGEGEMTLLKINVYNHMIMR